MQVDRIYPWRSVDRTFPGNAATVVHRACPSVPVDRSDQHQSSLDPGTDRFQLLETNYREVFLGSHRIAGFADRFQSDRIARKVYGS